MTPLGIEILLHYSTCAGPFPRIEAPAVADAVEVFCALGLLERGAEGQPRYIATEGARVYVMALCDVPLPVRRWIIPPPPSVEDAAHD